jgi:hypothetical protein
VPIIGFKPTKVRLVIEQTKESIVVMKVVVSASETVELATGGRLEALSGVLRIREQKGDRPRKDGRAIGSLVFIDASSRGEEHAPAKFQIDITMTEKKFDALLDVAISNRLPSKFFVQAGERVSARETRGITYVLRPNGRIKRWDNRAYRSLPVTNFSMILPIVVQDANGDRSEEEWPPPPETVASADQITELADEFAVFQGETKNTLTAVVSVVAVIGVLLLLINLVLLIK